MPKNVNIELIIEQLQEQYGSEVVVDEGSMRKALAEETHKYQGLGIKALSVVGGLLASSFFIGFLVMLLAEWSVLLLVIGTLAIVGAVLIDKMSTSAVTDTVVVSVYLSANLMIGMGIHQLTSDDNAIPGFLLFLSLTVPFLTKNYMLNFLSVVMVHGCLFTLLIVNSGKEFVHVFPLLPMMTFCFLSFKEPQLLSRNIPVNIRFNSLRTGVLVSLVAALVYSATVLYGSKTTYAPWVQYLSLPIWGSLLMIFLSFYAGYRTGLITGIPLLIYAIWQYYYNLQFSLLTKSYMMIGTGILFLMAWLIFKKKNG